MEKVTAYVTRLRDGVAQLLLLRDPGPADFGLVVPGGTVKEGDGGVWIESGCRMAFCWH